MKVAAKAAKRAAPEIVADKLVVMIFVVPFAEDTLQGHHTVMEGWVAKDAGKLATVRPTPWD